MNPPEDTKALRERIENLPYKMSPKITVGLRAMVPPGTIDQILQLILDTRQETVTYIADMQRCNLGQFCSKHQTHDVLELESQSAEGGSSE